MTAERPNLDFLPSALAAWPLPPGYLNRREEKAARRQRREAFLAQADSILERWGQEVDSRVLGAAQVQAQVRVGAGEAAVDLLLWRRVTILTAWGGFLTAGRRLYEISLRRAGGEEFRRFFDLRQEFYIYHAGQDRVRKVSKPSHSRNYCWGSDAQAQITDYDQVLAILAAIEEQLLA